MCFMIWKIALNTFTFCPRRPPMHALLDSFRKSSYHLIFHVKSVLKNGTMSETMYYIESKLFNMGYSVYGTKMAPLDIS